MDPNEPVFVIDLREPARDRDPGENADAPIEPGERIARVAIVGPDGEVTLHRIEPTRDRRLLDALARLIRFAHARGEPVLRVAERYGTEYERRLLFERRLPRWVLRYPDRG